MVLLLNSNSSKKKIAIKLNGNEENIKWKRNFSIYIILKFKQTQNYIWASQRLFVYMADLGMQHQNSIKGVFKRH